MTSMPSMTSMNNAAKPPAWEAFLSHRRLERLSRISRALLRIWAFNENERLKQAKNDELRVANYQRFQEWCASYVDDPSLPPIEVSHFSKWVFANNLTALPTEAVLRATFGKYGPIELVAFGLNENESSPYFGKPTRASIRFARDGDSKFARDGERWRRLRLEQERKALLAPSDSHPK
jgi:hypothetical protein